MSANRRVGVEVFVTGGQAKEEFAGVKSEINSIKTEAQAAGSAASVAMNGIQSSARATAAAMGSVKESIAANHVAIRDFGALIATSRAEMAALNLRILESASASGKDSIATQELKQQYGQLSALTRQLAADKGQLVAETGQLAAMQNYLKVTTQENTVAVETNTAAQTGAAAAAGLSAGKTVQVAAAMSRLTGSVIPGSRALALLANNFSMAIVPQLALILGVTLLIGWFIRLFKAQKDVTVGSGELLIADTLLASQLERTAGTSMLAASGIDIRRVASANLTTVVSSLIEHEGKLEASQRTVVEAQRNLEATAKMAADGTKLLIGTTQGGEPVYADMNARMEGFRTTIGKHTKDMEDNRKSVQDNVTKLNEWRAITGNSDDALIAFARSIGFTGPQLDQLTAALHRDTAAMVDLAAKAKEASGEVRSVMEARLALQLQEAGQKPPSFDVRGTPSGEAKEAQNLAVNLKAARQEYGSLTSAVMANRTALESHNKELERQAGAIGGAHGARAAYNKLIADEPAIIQKSLPILKASDDGYKALTATHHAGAGAARSRALAENSLTKALLDAQAVLIGDDFAARAKKIDNDIAAEREALRIKKQLNAQASADLISLEHARLEKVNQDRVFAEIKFQDELRQMEIKGIANEYDREQATINFQVEKKAEALIKEFGISRETTDKIMAYRKAAEEEFSRWVLDKTKHLAAEEEKLDAAEMKHASADYMTQIDARMKYEQDQFKKSEAEMKSLTDHLTQLQARSGGGSAQFFDHQRLEQDLKLLKDLGLTTKEVDQAFGSASHSADQWEQRLEILSGASVSFIGKMKQMVDWQRVLTEGIHGFTSAIAGAVAGTENLGRALLKSFFQIIGEIAIQLGTLMILAAAGFAFIPGLNWSAGALAAAGTALLVFGGVMEGLSQRFGQSNAAQGGSSAASGSGSSAATGTSTQRDPKPPINLPVSSFPRQPIVHVHFDSKETADVVLTALEAKGVFTRRTVSHGDNRRAIKNAAK